MQHMCIRVCARVCVCVCVCACVFRCTQQSLPDRLSPYTFHIAALPRGVGVMILLEFGAFWSIGVINLSGGEMDRAKYYVLDCFDLWFRYLAYDILPAQLHCQLVTSSYMSNQCYYLD